MASITLNVLLTIGPRPRAGREGRSLPLDGQAHLDTHPIPYWNYAIAMGNCMSANLRFGECLRADTVGENLA